MSASFILLSALALALYIAAAVGYSADLFLEAPEAPVIASGRTARLTRSARMLLALGSLVQVAATGVWCVTRHMSPFANEQGTLAILAWVMALTFLGFDLRFRQSAVAAVALPLVCLILLGSLLHSGGLVSDTRLIQNQIISLHVLTILASYALFALAFGCASLYLVQNRLLKARQAGSLFRRLPPLATLDNVAYHAVAYALPLLTLGLILGIAYLLSGHVALTPARWILDPHNLVSFATWLLYLLYLAARLGMGWRGIRLQYILVVGLFVALALYVLPTSTHRFTGASHLIGNGRASFKTSPSAS